MCGNSYFKSIARLPNTRGLLIIKPYFFFALHVHVIRHHDTDTLSTFLEFCAGNPDKGLLVWGFNVFLMSGWAIRWKKTAELPVTFFPAAICRYQPNFTRLIQSYFTGTRGNHTIVLVIGVEWYIDISVQDCGNSTALVMEIMQSCNGPSIYFIHHVVFRYW